MSENIFYNPGAFGDIIYSIPFCLSCVGTYSYNDLSTNKYKLLLDLCCVHKKKQGNDLAFKNLLWVAQIVKMQPYIDCLICEPKVDWNKFGALDLGIIRKGRINMASGDISLRNNFLRRQLKYYNLYEPWLIIPQDNKFDYMKDKIIIFRTSRYRNARMDYRILKDISNRLVYIGTQQQYLSFCMQNGFKCLFYRLNNFVQGCQMMQKCAFVIGNQTFFFSLAEALKIPRILQFYRGQPDVIPHGDYANDCVDTQDFKVLLKLYMDKFLG